MQIHPEIYFSRIKNVQFIAEKIVRGFFIGKHKSPTHGYAIEFAEHKQYTPGDPLKHVDWKLLAKTEKLYSKKYEQETNLNCYMFIDTSSSMTFSDNNNEMSKLDFALISAACLAYVLRKQVDALSLTLFADEIMEYYPAKSSPQHYQDLFNAMERLLHSKSENKSTNLQVILDSMTTKTRKRGLVVLFTDFLTDMDISEDLIETIKHLSHLGHQVLIFQVVDSKKEISLEYENRPIQFVDIESGASIITNPSVIKTEYADIKRKSISSLQDLCTSYGIEHILVDIHQSFDQILLPFFAKRK